MRIQFLEIIFVALVSLGTLSCEEQEIVPLRLCETPKYTDWYNLSFGLDSYFDYKSGLACAKEQQRPILVHFTAHGSCGGREIVLKVKEDAELIQFITSEFIPVTLYVDDKTELPKDEWITVNERLLKTIGAQNSQRQMEQFNVNCQPYWVVLDQYENVMVEPLAYTNDLNEIREFFHDAATIFNAIHTDKFEDD